MFAAGVRGIATKANKDGIPLGLHYDLDTGVMGDGHSTGNDADMSNGKVPSNAMSGVDKGHMPHDPLQRPSRCVEWWGMRRIGVHVA